MTGMKPEPLRVDLWCLPLPSSVADRDVAVISMEEHRRAARLHRESDRIAFLAARVALRRCLSTWLGRPPEAIRIEDRRGSKPAFPDLTQDTDVSLSHGPGRMLIAICEGARVGIDLEQVAPVDLDLAELVCSTRELAALMALASEDRGRAFTRMWTRKEAITKAIGVGMVCDLQAIEVSLTEQARLLRFDGEVVADWQIVSLRLGPSWEAALALEARTRPLDVRRLPCGETFGLSLDPPPSRIKRM